MKTHPSIRRSMLGVLLALLIVPAAGAQKIAVQFDEVAARNAATVRAMLAGKAHFLYTGDQPIEAVVVVLEVMDSTITRSYLSAPVTLRPGVTFTPGDDQLPDTTWFPAKRPPGNVQPGVDHVVVIRDNPFWSTWSPRGRDIVPRVHRPFKSPPPAKTTEGDTPGPTVVMMVMPVTQRQSAEGAEPIVIDVVAITHVARGTKGNEGPDRQ